MRHRLVLAAVLVTALPAPAADPPTGAYRLSADVGFPLNFLLAFSSQNNQPAGQFLGGLDLEPQLKPSVRDVRVTGDRLRFTLVIAGNQQMTFDGKLPAGRGPIPGSLGGGDALVVVTLEPSALTKFDRSEFLKEIATAATGPLRDAATLELLRSATAAKAKPEDVRAWADRAAKAAEPFGVRWQIVALVRLAQALDGQPAYSAVALDLARRAERLLDPSEQVGLQLDVFDLLARLTRQANDPAAAAQVQARLEAIEARDYQEYVAAFPLRPEPFAGRKVKSDRAVLVELFSSAEDPSSVAAALAFDALPRVYKPTDVVRLQYDLHLPEHPDPLATKAGDARWKYYGGRPTGGTPTTVIGGKADPTGGGAAEFSPAKLKQYRAMIDPRLDQPAGAAVQVSATRAGERLTITAKVSGVAKPNDKVRLRVAVAEAVVRFRGGNGLRYHQCVVRGFAGTPDGIPLTRPVVEQQAVVDLGALRAALNAELDEYQKKNEGWVFADRPMGLKKLVVVAFVQDDATRDVLQAGQVEVP
jgi:hypothetical protein